MNKQSLVKILLTVIFFANKGLWACCLTQIADSPVSAEVRPEFVAYHPNGTCVAVNNNGSNTISVFTVNQDTCGLTLAQTISSGGITPIILAYSPTGSCLAVTNLNTPNVAIFRVDPVTCLLELADTAIVGNQPIGLVFSPDGSCLIVANRGSDTVTRFSVDANCELTQIGLPIPTNPAPSTLAFSPNGQCLGIVHSTSPGTISLYSFDQSDCSLTFLNSTSTMGDFPEFFAISPNGQCIVAANENSNNLATFTFDQNNCTLSFVETENVPAGSLPIVPVFSPDSSCLAVTLGNLNTISTFNVNPNCSLTFNNNFSSFGAFPFGLAYSPDGRCLTVANFQTAPVNGNIVTYNIFTVTVEPPFEFLCEGQTIELTAEVFGGTPPFTFSWTGPNGFASNDQMITIPNIGLANAGVYTVTVTDQNGCVSTAQSIVFIAMLRTMDEVFTTCVNQKLNIMPGTILRNARFIFIPQIVSTDIQREADLIFGPILQNSTVELVASPSFGKLVLNPDGSFTYVPFCNFTGEDSFIVDVFADNGDCSFSSQINVTVQVNQCCAFNMN